MPQASKELRDMFEDDGVAWKELGSNFCDDKGIIRRRDKTVLPTAKQYCAIDYLCDEWDYSWEGLRREERLEMRLGALLTFVKTPATREDNPTLTDLLKACREELRPVKWSHRIDKSKLPVY